MYSWSAATTTQSVDTNAVWVDAGQMMTTRTSDTQTQKAHKTHKSVV